MPDLEVVISLEDEEVATVEVGDEVIYDMSVEDEVLEDHLELWVETGFEQLGPGPSAGEDTLTDAITIVKLTGENVPAFLFSLEDLGYDWEIERIEGEEEEK